MSSVIEGYSYDIFISYRQKDNKGDRWVSEFVEALKTELESTFKEEISVYFDINPHDGLLETHDVDASLKDKLKCLIFIPVMSRTYCDPKSFAWQHEFVAFVEQASSDRFGLKIKLPHGNVATRVLPVKIHELDPADQMLCEKILGGVPRGVDFIFKSSGVNRPLRMNEDNPRDNLNHTFYRDQINKVANAIDEIISAIKNPLPENVPGRKGGPVEPDKADKGKSLFPAGKYAKLLLAICCIAVLSVFAYLYLHEGDRKDDKLSIAFIPFQVAPGDYSLMNEEDNFVEAVRNKLSKIGSIEVLPRISTLQFRETELSMRKIRGQLKADYYIGGRVWRDEEKTRIFIEVSDSKKGNILWQTDFSWSNDNSAIVTNDVVSILTGKLKLLIDPDETKLVFSELTGNAEANMNYLSGNARTIDSRFYVSYDYENDSSSFLHAIRSYDKAIELEPQFAEAYIGRSIASSWGVFLKQLDTSYIIKSKSDIDRAAALDPDLPELKIALAFYYYQCTENLDSALHYFSKAAEQNPSDYQPVFYLSMVYRKLGKWETSRALISKVAGHNPREALFLTNIGLTYDYLHKYDSAIKYHKKAIELMPDWDAAYINLINSLTVKSGNTREAWKYVNSALRMTGDSLIRGRVLLNTLDRNYKEVIRLAEKTRPDRSYPDFNRYLDIAAVYRFSNDATNAVRNYEIAQNILEKLVLNNPYDPDIHGNLAISLAGTGKRTRAVEEAQKGIDLLSKNAMDKSDMVLNLARVYTITGDYGHAIDIIESLLSGYSQLSVRLLKADPVWEPLYNVNEFKKIIKKYSS